MLRHLPHSNLNYNKPNHSNQRRQEPLEDLLFLGKHIRMQFFMVNEETANVQDITSKATDGFDEPSLILVQSNGLKIDDNIVTQSQILEKISSLDNAINKSNVIKCDTNEDVQALKKEFKSAKFMGIISDTFTCCICLDIVKSPVVVASCCKRVACKTCNDNWIATTCPHCRSSESTFIEVNCFDRMLDHYNEIND